MHRFAERDRAAFERLRLTSTTRPFWVSSARALTHLGGARATILLAVAPLLTPRWYHLGEHALLTLVLSHVLVQFIKRTVGRPRPSCAALGVVLIHEPDQFSFPSGHAAAALSIALAYSSALPSMSLILLILAGVVGGTRVLLGVHYPGDVAAGQSIAVLTHWMLLAAHA